MNIKYILAVVATLVIIGVVIFYALTRNPVQPTANNQSIFPTATSSNTIGGVSYGSGVLKIKGINGEEYSIPDITQGKKSDVLPAGTYYHITNNQETLGTNAEFEMQYGTDNSISIVILKESLKDSRTSAENYLRSTLKLSNSDLCSLDITIIVPAAVNTAFADENLGLSFCPNAVVLP
jgi:hypothetical protein